MEPVALDPRTLTFCTCAVSLVTGIVLTVYDRSQRTFPGFAFWIASSFILSAAQAMLVLHDAIAPGISVILSHAFFVLGAVLRLDGLRLFLRGRPAWRGLYAVPFVEAAGAFWLFAAQDGIASRVALQSVVLAAISIATAVVVLRNSPSRRGGFLWIMVVMNIVAAVSLVGRSLGWLISPLSGIFDSDPVQDTHLFVMMVFEICWCLIIMMLNSQRLDGELRASQDELHATVRYLEQALANVKTLSGLLPICSCCKKIRDDKGYWSQIETYISLHSDAEFSHGLCPECARKLYPDLSR